MAVMRAPQTAAVAVVKSLGEQNMPHVIAVGTRSPASLLTRITESLLARLLWISGRVPHGVTPTLGTSRWWR
jgi:NaMN:DMB phosphoribosyltransferase